MNSSEVLKDKGIFGAMEVEASNDLCPKLVDRHVLFDDLMANDLTASRCVRFEAFATLQAVGLDEFLIFGERLLGVHDPADAAIGPAQLKICGVTIGDKFFCGFEIFNGANCITLLQERAAQFQARHFIVWLGQDNLAQDGHGRFDLALQ